MADVLKRALESGVTPGRILCRHSHHELTDLHQDIARCIDHAIVGHPVNTPNIRLDHRERQALAYLVEENRVLRRQLG